MFVVGKIRHKSFGSAFSKAEGIKVFAKLFYSSVNLSDDKSNFASL